MLQMNSLEIIKTFWTGKMCILNKAIWHIFALHEEKQINKATHF